MERLADVSYISNLPENSNSHVDPDQHFDSFKLQLPRVLGNTHISSVYNPLASSFIGTYFLDQKTHAAI
jgi:hypothetical protein